MQLFRIFNISLEVHWSFLLFAGLVLSLSFLVSFPYFLATALVFFFLFLSVFLHELAHSVVALSKGARVEKILLLPIGGVAITEELPEKPWDEFWIAVAGPLFNFGVALLILLLSFFLPLPFPSFEGGFSEEAVTQAVYSYPLFAVLWVNLLLGSFNLFLPALPLDGGRVARSLLSLRFGYEKATRHLVRCSLFLAALLFLFGLFYSIWLSLIAVFIYLGAQQEGRMALTQARLARLSLASLVNPKPLLLEGSRTLGETLREMLRQHRFAFLVRLPSGYGLVSLDTFFSVSKSQWHRSLESVLRPLPCLSLQDKPGKVLEKMYAKSHLFLPVLDQGHLLGIVEMAELETALRLEELRMKN